MVLISILTGVLVSACGVIGFVGLVIPHIVRSLVGADHKSYCQFVFYQEVYF